MVDLSKQSTQPTNTEKLLQVPRKTNFEWLFEPPEPTFLGGYVDLLEYRLREEPIWPSESISFALMDLIQREDQGVFRSTRALQGAINGTILSIAKKYNSKITVLRGQDSGDSVFDMASLFPIHTLEWTFATLEFIVQHRRELSWIYDVTLSRTLKGMRKRYTPFVSRLVEKKIDEIIPTKNLDWNICIVDILREMAEKKAFDHGFDVIRDITGNVARKSWGSKDMLELESMCASVLANNKLSDRSKIGVMFFCVTGNMVVKNKDDGSPFLDNGRIKYPIPRDPNENTDD